MRARHAPALPIGKDNVLAGRSTACTNCDWFRALHAVGLVVAVSCRTPNPKDRSNGRGRELKAAIGLCGQIKCEVLSRAFRVQRLHFALGLFQIFGGVNPEDTTARFISENIDHFKGRLEKPSSIHRDGSSVG